MINLLRSTAKFGQRRLVGAFAFSTAARKWSVAKDIPAEVPKTQMSMLEAIRSAQDQAMEENPKALAFGEDVKFGGVFRCTLGLYEKYGVERVFNTPLAEQGIAAFAIGLAAVGYTPICEMQFADYIFPAFDQIVNEAAKFRYRTGDQFHVGGLTIRTPCGAVGHGGHYHSQHPEAYFSHTPGLVVVCPREPIQAKGLLIASIREKNPVIFLEPKALYRNSGDDVPTESFELELRKADVVKEGNNITLIGWGAQLRVITEASKMAAAEGINCEIIDLQTLYPYDLETLVKSVKKTGRCIISHEAPVTSGLGAEISAAVQEKCWSSLEAPIQRVCGYDTPFPMTHEPLYLPDKLKVYEAIKKTMSY